jgi:hypothetical protein
MKVNVLLLLLGYAAVEGYITHTAIARKSRRQAAPESASSSWIENLKLLLPGEPKAVSKNDIYAVYKKDLLKAISATRTRKTLASGGEGMVNDRMAILQAVAALEAEYVARSPPDNNPNTCAGGEWSLIYSTKQASSTAALNPSIVDIVSGQLYKVFFKFAPFLAGSQDDTRASPVPQQQQQQVSNKQLIDLVNGKVLNTVTLPKVPIFNKPVTIKVSGEVEQIYSGGTLVPGLLSVIFTDFSLMVDDGGSVRLPLPRPRGSLRTTFCDGDLRVSRGGQGGVFVVKRMA